MNNKILGVNPAQKKFTYVDFELTKYSVDELKEAYENWRLDLSYINKYDGYEFLNNTMDLVLVRVFRFEKESTLLAPGTEDKLVQTKILPFCKVIKSTNPSILPGTILLAPDRICDIVTNIDWLKWKDIVEKERPTLDIPEPEKTSGLITEWRNTSKFVLDKFQPNTDDEYTFIRPLSEFKVKVV